MKFGSGLTTTRRMGFPAAWTDSCLALLSNQSGIKQEAFETFDELVAPSQETPSPRYFGMLLLQFRVHRLRGAHFGRECAIEATLDVVADSLKHLTHSLTKAVLMIDATSTPEDLRSLFAARRTER